MRLTIDRIEGVTVVCETPERETLPLPIELFTFPIKDGDLIEYDGITPVPLTAETESRKAKLRSRFTALTKPKPQTP